MFPNPADGSCADRAPGTVGAVRRRRDRRLRASLKHERVTVAMNLATIQHHSYMKSAVVDAGVQVGSPLAPVADYVAPAPAVSFVVPCQQLRPAYTTATVATGVHLNVSGKVCPQFSRTAVESSASQVVDPLPLACNQVHRERFSASELPENIADIPVVQEQVVVQVIVQTIPRVAGTLPPIAKFTVPAYSPVHQEQFSAGDTSENFANIPVVQDQFLVQAIPRVVGSLPPVQEFTAYVARRPSPLAEVWPSERAQRHFMEDLGELAPSVQLLDLPVPQMVENVTDTLLRILDFPIAEQVIDVPKIFCSPCPSRSRVPEPQLADQLVEVPTVLTPRASHYRSRSGSSTLQSLVVR